MEYRVLTVSREFGSGGGRIAQSIAKRLNWKLLDAALIEEIASEAHVDAGVVTRFDEHVDGWLRRLNRQVSNLRGELNEDLPQVEWSLAKGVRRTAVERRVRDVVDRELAGINVFCRDLAAGKYTVC